jgi:hypothetical protein
MQRYSLAKYLAFMVMIKGFVASMHAVSHYFGILAAIRFIMGAFEVCTVPTYIYVSGS